MTLRDGWNSKRIKDRVEIRGHAVGVSRPSKQHGSWAYSHFAQVLVVVDKDSVRMSMNGTAELEPRELILLTEYIAKAKQDLGD